MTHRPHPARSWRLAALLGLCVLFPLPGRAQGGGRADAAWEIRRLRESSNAAITRHDTAGLGAILAPNVIVVSSNSAHIDGREANVHRFAEQFRNRPDVTYRRVPATVRVFAPWGMASEQGRWSGSWTEAGGKVSIGGTYFAKWRQLNGAWHVESETYVPDRCRGTSYCSVVP